jgi:hypothetical protein
MFADIEADYYVLVDGDDTCDASIAPRMVAIAREQQLAMLVARRVHEVADVYKTRSCYRKQTLCGIPSLRLHLEFGKDVREEALTIHSASQ